MDKVIEIWNKIKRWYKSLDLRLKIALISFIASGLISPWFVTGYMVCHTKWIYKDDPNVSAKKVWTAVVFALMGMFGGYFVNKLIY